MDGLKNWGLIMNLIVANIAISVLLTRVIILKISYIKSFATCLDYNTGRSFTSFPLYEYEMIEDGVKVVYKNRGTAFFYPKKGKRYKVLIHKKDHNKIVGYSDYVSSLVILCLMFLCVLLEYFSLWQQIFAQM